MEFCFSSYCWTGGVINWHKVSHGMKLCSRAIPPEWNESMEGPWCGKSWYFDRGLIGIPVGLITDEPIFHSFLSHTFSLLSFPTLLSSPEGPWKPFADDHHDRRAKSPVPSPSWRDHCSFRGRARNQREGAPFNIASIFYSSSSWRYITCLSIQFCLKVSQRFRSQPLKSIPLRSWSIITKIRSLGNKIRETIVGKVAWWKMLSKLWGKTIVDVHLKIK